MPGKLCLTTTWWFMFLPWSPLSSAQTLTAEELAKFDSRIFAERSPSELGEMMAVNIGERIRRTNQRSSSEWRAISGLEQWKAFVGKRLEALRDSLGEFPEASGPSEVHVSGVITGDGFRIENLIFESRPRLWVTANLYVPDPVRASMPGMILAHSHHNPKSQGELQDMGMTWARLGCLVLVMDLAGHGERSDHPFRSTEDYDGEFGLGRQDYYFRYNLGIQLQLMGDSLMGWIVYDLRRALDLLLSRDGIDPKRIILIGSVAGGGDPAAVTAALEPRITAAIPFNFGGPEPESPYPLPEDAEESFDYATNGSWESTRNLRLSCRDGFLPWVVVSGIAPRRLVYAHEFAWDQERDPVWKRLRRVFGEFYGVPDHLASTHGFGQLRQRPPDASHCNNVGAVHRKRIHLALQQWFQIDGSPDKEFSARRAPEELVCLTDAFRERLQPLKIHELAGEIGRARWLETSRKLRDMKPDERREILRQRWRGILGELDPRSDARVVVGPHRSQFADGIWAEKVGLEVEPGILVPLITLGTSRGEGRRPIVLGVAQGGKGRFLKERSEELAGLLAGGVVVCLMDLRGTGETAVAGGRGRSSRGTSIAASELMLGQTLVGSRLRDLRSVLAYLRRSPELDAERIAVLGDSFTTSNPADANLVVPLGVEATPGVCEPLGGLLSLLVALFEEDVKVVYSSGGILSYACVLASPFCYVPYDVVVPGATGAGDLQLLAGVLAPRAIMLEGLVDGQNRRVEQSAAEKVYAPAFEAYRSNPAQFVLNEPVSRPEVKIAWILDALLN